MQKSTVLRKIKFIFSIQVTETKCSTETVVAAEFHPLEAGTIVSIGKGHANFWQLDSTALTLSRKTGLFDQVLSYFRGFS